MSRTALALVLLAALVAPLAARPLAVEPSGLGGLVLPHTGRAMHASSADPAGGNIDFRVLASGDSLTLLDPLILLHGLRRDPAGAAAPPLSGPPVN